MLVGNKDTTQINPATVPEIGHILLVFRSFTQA